jgi:hypothetical protein
MVPWLILSSATYHFVGCVVVLRGVPVVLVVRNGSNVRMGPRKLTNKRAF